MNRKSILTKKIGMMLKISKIVILPNSTSVQIFIKMVLYFAIIISFWYYQSCYPHNRSSGELKSSLGGLCGASGRSRAASLKEWEQGKYV